MPVRRPTGLVVLLGALGIAFFAATALLFLSF
jgi:hypothetical protein